MSRARFAILVAALAWAAGIVYGAERLWRFESTPGNSGQTPAAWPLGSSIRPVPGKSTLVMLVHPECSCSEASLSELATVMEQQAQGIDAWVLFIQPADAPRTPIWGEAARIAGVHVAVDPLGAEALRFGALTSGYLVLYDPRGHLLFSGGITGARGHAGDNMGREELMAAAAARPSTAARHAVFGCPLSDDASMNTLASASLGGLPP